MNHSTRGATEAHSLPQEPAGPRTVGCVVLSFIVVIIVAIMEGAQLAPPHLPAQVTTHWLSGETSHPGSVLKWSAVQGGYSWAPFTIGGMMTTTELSTVWQMTSQF